MKVNTAAVAFVSLMLAAAYIGCGKGGSDDQGIFVPDLSQTWQNKADATGTNTFFFLIDSVSKNSSAFTGNENPAGGGAQFHFTGSFTNRNIQFTYDAGSSKSGKSYSGTINDASNQMTLSSTQLGSLVLEKH